MKARRLPRMTDEDYRDAAAAYAVSHAHQEIYAIPIYEWLAAQDKRPSLIKVYDALDALVAEGRMTTRWVQGTPERGGRRKRLYTYLPFRPSAQL